MRLCTSLFLLLLLVSCQSSRQEKPHHQINYTAQIDSLATRYHELNRFSGVILVARHDSIIFNKAYGLANYEIGKSFTDSTAFRIDDLARRYAIEVSLPKNLATGYTGGLHREPINKQNQEETTGFYTANALYQFTQKQDSLELSGYTPEDGFSYAIEKDKDIALTIIVLSNYRHPIGDEITEAIEAIMQHQPYQMPLPRCAVSLSAEDIKPFAGTYAVNENFALTFKNRQDSLFLVMGDQEMSLIPQSANQFYMENSDAAVRFHTDSTPTVTKVELLDGFIKGNMAYRME